MKKAVLIGNGINYSLNVWSWPEVVKRLAANGNIPLEEDDLNSVPLSLLAEQVLCKGASSYHTFVNELKSHLLQLQPSEVHRKLVSGSFDEVLTTNYDLTLESAKGLGRSEYRNAGWAKETKYSQFRHVACSGGPKIWHIHGDIEHPDSLILGYERYGGYLQVIRQTITEGRHYRGEAIGPLKKLLDPLSVRPWSTFFFTHDVLILGTSFDFAEIHLWWLLAYRANKWNGSQTSLYPHNRIIYVWNKEGESTPLHHARARQLEALGVSVVEESWTGSDWTNGYCDVLDRFAKGTL